MITLARTTRRTTAEPSAVFALWADIDSWADHDGGIEWAQSTGPFVEGGQYIIKPKGGPKTKADIVIVEPNERFVDVSHLIGANLRFDHSISQSGDDATVDVVMTLDGPLSWLWAKILGKNQQADLEKSTARLVAKAEAA